jgi:hypothetical protein
MQRRLFTLRRLSSAHSFVNLAHFISTIRPAPLSRSKSPPTQDSLAPRYSHVRRRLVGSSSTDLSGSGSVHFIRHFTLELASVAKSCLMVERGGRKKPASGMSSKPSTEMVPGIWIPLSSKARIAPNAIWSFATTRAEYSPQFCQLLRRFEPRLSGPISSENGPWIEASRFQFLKPTFETQFRRPPKGRSLQIGDFPMSELDQVLRGDAGPEFLINIDSGAFESQIGIDCYDRHIAVDAFVVSRQ